MKQSITRLLAIFSLLALVISTFATGPGPSLAQGDSRTFPETGKTVQGRFLAYWTANGALAQQGFPLSEEMQEKSDTDGKTYTVQYFERAVFELHADNQPPNDVLLQLLGVFRYKQKYPNGAPQQSANTSTGSLRFAETGKRLGGQFLSYWQVNGALTQQGYPISEEFQERSDLDGKLYTVQYFERAVFELHSENQPPYDILLSQLGTFQYKQKYLQPPSTPTGVPATSVPVATPGSIADCSGIPASQNITVTPACAPAGSLFNYVAAGFPPEDRVSLYTTRSDSRVVDPTTLEGTHRDAQLPDWQLSTHTVDPQGIWAVTIEDLVTGQKATGYFKITAPLPPDCSGIEPNRNTDVRPNCVKAGESVEVSAHDYNTSHDTYVFVSIESPSGKRMGIGGAYPGANQVSGRITTDDKTERGMWKVIFTGYPTGAVSAIGYYKILAP